MAALLKKCQIYLDEHVYKGYDEYKKTHACQFFMYQFIAGLLCATVIILGVAALFAAGVCESLTEFHLATTSTSFLGLKNIVIINRSPHGEITMTAASSGFNGGDALKIESKNYAVNDDNRKMLTSSQLLDATTFSVLASAVDESKFLGIDVSCEHVFSNMALHNFTGTVNLRGERDAGIKVSSEAPFELGKAGLYVEHLNIQADTGAINVTGISTSSLKVTVPKLPFQIRKPRGVYLQNVVSSYIQVQSDSRDIHVDGAVLPFASRLNSGGNGRALNVSTKTGDIFVSNVGEGGDIFAASQEGNIVVRLNGRAFHGAYNAQAGQGVVFFSPTSSMHKSGPVCSPTDSWKKLPSLKEGIGALHHHCKQGHVGFAYGKQRVELYTASGDITLISSEPDI